MRIQDPKFGVLFASICRAPLWLQRMLLRPRAMLPASAAAETAPGAREEVYFGLPSEVEGGEWKMARQSRTHRGEGKGKRPG